jgi:hypothetical protein
MMNNTNLAAGARIGAHNRTPKALRDAAFPLSNTAPAPRRKSICGRDINAGPGSCAFWFESCPSTVRHCIQRFFRDNQQAAGDPATEAAALARWEAARAIELQPQRELL